MAPSHDRAGPAPWERIPRHLAKRHAPNRALLDRKARALYHSVTRRAAGPAPGGRRGRRSHGHRPFEARSALQPPGAASVPCRAAAGAALVRRGRGRRRRRAGPVRPAPGLHGRGGAPPAPLARGGARAGGALPGDGRRRRGLPAGGRQPAPGGEDRPRVPAQRLPPPRPGPGGQHGPHAGGEEVRSVQGREALLLRRLVDPRLHHPLHHGQLAAGEARHHPGPAQALLQPGQGAREAPRPRHRAHAPAAGQEPPGGGLRRGGDERAHGGARTSPSTRRRRAAATKARARRASTASRVTRSAPTRRWARSSCGASSGRSWPPSRPPSPTRRRSTSSRTASCRRRARSRPRCRRWATASASPASAPARSRPRW